jgi:hypothetical protein
MISQDGSVYQFAGIRDAKVAAVPATQVPFGRAESDDLPRTVCGKLLWGGTCGPRRIDPRMLCSIPQHRWFLRLIQTH